MFFFLKDQEKIEASFRGNLGHHPTTQTHATRIHWFNWELGKGPDSPCGYSSRLAPSTAPFCLFVFLVSAAGHQPDQAGGSSYTTMASRCFVVKQPRHVMAKKTPSIARHRGAERNRDTYSGPDKPPPWTSELGGVHRNPPRPGFRSSAGPEVGRARCLDRLRFSWLGPCPVQVAKDSPLPAVQSELLVAGSLDPACRTAPSWPRAESSGAGSPGRLGMAGHLRRLALRALSASGRPRRRLGPNQARSRSPPAGNTTYTGSEKDDLQQAGGQTTTTTQTWLTSGALFGHMGPSIR